MPPGPSDQGSGSPTQELLPPFLYSEPATVRRDELQPCSRPTETNTNAARGVMGRQVVLDQEGHDETKNDVCIIRDTEVPTALIVPDEQLTDAVSLESVELGDIGAEVVLSAIESPSDVPVSAAPRFKAKVDLSRRWSYEEVVHKEPEEEENEYLLFEQASDKLKSSSDLSQGQEEEPDDILLPLKSSLRRNLTILTQWALTLQEVSDERAESCLKPESIRCLCSRADALVHELQDLERVYMETLDVLDQRMEPQRILSINSLYSDRLTDHVKHMQDRLRAHVSISISNPSYEIRSKSAFLVGAVCDMRHYIREAVQSLHRLVLELMDVNDCEQHHHLEGKADVEENPLEPIGMAVDSEHDVEEDSSNGGQDVDEEASISHAVELFCTMEEDEDEDLDGDGSMTRKRKKDPKSISPPTSPTSSPSKRPRVRLSVPAEPNTVALELLERNRKLVRSNGLYQFVLWREALRAAKCQEGSNRV